MSDDQQRSMATVGVIGAGTMGSGIAETFAQAGYDVVLVDTSDEFLDRGLKRITSALDRLVEKERLTSENRDAILTRIEGSTDHDTPARARPWWTAGRLDFSFTGALLPRTSTAGPPPRGTGSMPRGRSAQAKGRAMRFRYVTLAALAVVLAVGAGVLAGTGQGRTNAPSGNIVFAHWASSPVETALLKEVVAAFEKKYPAIKVRRRALDPYPASMLAQFAARKPPDVFYVDSNVAPDWIRQGLLEPLNGYITRTKFDTSKFYPRLLGAFRDSKNQLYGLPKDWSPLAMQTNTAMFSKAGAQVPTTWATLNSTATKLRSAVGGGKPICVAADWARLLAFVYQNGGSFLSADRTKATVNTTAVRKAAEFYVGLKSRGLAGTPAELGVGWCGEALGKEKAAIVFEGNWIVPYMAESFPTIRYANNAMIKNKSAGNLAFTVSYSIAKDSKKKDAAWTFLSYLTGPEGMKIWTSKGLALPSRSDVKPVAGRAAFLGAAPNARPWQFAPGFSDVITVAGNELSAVFEGKQSISSMLEKIQSEAERTLRRGR